MQPIDAPAPEGYQHKSLGPVRPCAHVEGTWQPKRNNAIAHGSGPDDVYARCHGCSQPWDDSPTASWYATDGYAYVFLLSHVECLPIEVWAALERPDWAFLGEPE